jgi:hypothetical protein
MDETDPTTGNSLADRAGRALAEHASQGMDFFMRSRWRDAFTASTYFSLVRSAIDAPLDSLDLAGNLPPNTSASPDLSYLIDAGRVPEIPAENLIVDDRFASRGQRLLVSWPDSILPKTASLSFEFEAPEGSRAESINHTSEGVVATLRIASDAPFTWPTKTYQYDRFLSRPPIRYALRDGAGGPLLAAGYVPVDIAPAIVLDDLPDVVRLEPGKNEITIKGTVYRQVSRCEYVKASLRKAGNGEILAEDTAVPTIDGQDRFAASLTLELPEAVGPGDYMLHIDARGGRIDRTEVEQPARVLGVDVADGLQVGVVESYDGTFTEALRVLGIEPVLLDSAALASADLSSLHTIVVDIRAYLARSDLRRYNDRLLDWVASGGHLMVNYQKTFEWNPDSRDPFDPEKTNPDNLAPYPIVLGRDRVTLEDAPVEVLVPDHPLLTTPNAINENDWTGWVQERGLYFPESYDDRYTELFSLHDPGEEPLRGATLLAHYGEGSYLYSALVWYRQLHRYHQGAFRIFANIISYPLTRS